ncbi:MAG TPA: CbbX protein, partial [Nitrosospira sp.]
AFGEYVHLRMKLEHFANARSVRNALDRARLRQANRLFEGARRNLSRVDLMTIEAEDIRASRVFREGAVDLDGDEGANEAPPAS